MRFRPTGAGLFCAAAVAELEDVGTYGREERLIVADRDHRGTVFQSIEEHLHQPRPRQRILTEGRLIDDEHPWPGSQHRRHRQATLLPT